LLLLHWGVALAAASPLPPGPAEDEIYPFSLRYRQQVEEHIGLAQLPTAAGLFAPFPDPGWPARLEGALPTGPAGTDLLYALKSLRW
jgi:hypothetical protein